MKFTVEAVVKFVPVIVSVRAGPPTTWALGFSAVMAGATTKAVVLVAVPLGVVTAITPLVEPVGTLNVMVVLFTTVKTVIATPFSVTAVAPVKPVPVMVTVVGAVPVETGPLVGVKLVIVGPGAVTVKLTAAEVPPPGAGLVAVTG